MVVRNGSFVKPAGTVALLFRNLPNDFHGFGFSDMTACREQGIEQGDGSGVRSAEGSALNAGEKSLLCDAG